MSALSALGVPVSSGDGHARVQHLGAVILLVICGAAFAFQVLHMAEHVVQLVKWSERPTIPAPMSGLAMSASAWLAVTVTNGYRGTSMEVLHLIGNLVFLTGAVAGLVGLSAPRRSPAARRTLRLLVLVQGLHVAEHLVLVTTLMRTGVADGVTTAFGLLTPGTPSAIAARVLLHFVLNVAVTVIATIAVARAAESELRTGQA